MSDNWDEPYPGYVYGPAASARADALQKLGRDATLKLAEGGLFDTEPALLEKALARLADKAS